MRGYFRVLNVIAILFCAYGVSLAATDPCLGCHEEKTPGIVAYWRASAHPGKGVTCVNCHGGDIDANHEGSSRVGIERCGDCHKRALKEHGEGKHAVSLMSGRGCTRNEPASPERDRGCSFCHKPGSAEPFVQSECAMFLAQTPEMQRVGCGSCHRVGAGCDSCHTRHGTDLALAGAAETCGVCHMGPDHAQYEMWRSSIHGVIFGRGGPAAAPTCVTCHMSGGTHDVSRGIATGRSAETSTVERDKMLDICARCHTRKMALRSLADADDVEVQSRAILGKAIGIVARLGEKGLLLPSPADRPEHPLFGHEVVVGPHMLYENISRPEATVFRMMMFYYMSAFKGAFHQNPDYAHWFGNAPLKLGLSDVQSDAEVLEKIDAIEKRIDNMKARGGEAPSEGLAGELRGLKDRFLKGEISPGEYERLKAEALDRGGL